MSARNRKRYTLTYNPHAFLLNRKERFAMPRSIHPLLLSCVLLLVLLTGASGQTVTLQAVNAQPKGWGADGWGSYRFVLKNASGQDAVLVKWAAHWEAQGRTFGGGWGG